VKVRKLRQLLKGTHAQVIQASELPVVVPCHQYRLASEGEVLQSVSNDLPELLTRHGRLLSRILGRNPNSIVTPEPPTPLYTPLALGDLLFETRSDVKIYFHKKRLLAIDCDDYTDSADKIVRYVVRCAIFGESLGWGPKTIPRPGRDKDATAF